MLAPEKLKEIKRRFEEIEQEMADPEVATDAERMQELSREHGELREVVAVIKRYERMLSERDDLEEMVREEDGELAEMAQDELDDLRAKLPVVEEELKMKLIPKDPDRKSVV